MSNKYNNYHILKRLLQRALDYKQLFFGCLVVAIILALTSSFRPYYITQIINETLLDFGETLNSATSNELKKQYQTLVIQCALLIGLVFIEAVFSFFLTYYSNVLAQNVIKKMRMQLYNKLIHFKNSYFDKTPIGTLVTRSVSDIETVATVYTDGILLFFGDILRIIAVVGFMFYLNVQLSLISLIVFPLMFIVTRFFQRAIKKTFSNERTYTSEMNAYVQERLSGMSIVQVFNQQLRERNKFKTYNQNLLNANLKTVFYFALFFPFVEFVSSLTVGLIIYYGGKEFLATENFKVGDIIGFVFYINMLVRPLRQIADRFNTMQRGIVGSERVFKIMDNEESIPNIGTLQPVFKGKIEFKNVDFSYIKGEKVLKNLSFIVQPGENIAVVGATGAGKSTIINLLSRFYEIDNGEILIDGHNIKDIELNYLRSQIGVVLQDVFLFNDTLYNNIVLDNTNISKEEVRKAAKEIGIDTFIESLPNTYDYKVSERGNSLSSGQKQLISYLRFYLYNPSILVLDEATSSIDTLTEELIQKATTKLTENRTSIAIAHRLATIQNADTIMVLENGELVEKGSHEELMKLKKYYYKLYQAQFQQMNLE